MNLTANQLEYQKIYSTLAEVICQGDDHNGNEWADLLRSLLIRSWYSLSTLERKPFMGPGVLVRRQPGKRKKTQEELIASGRQLEKNHRLHRLRGYRRRPDEHAD